MEHQYRDVFYGETDVNDTYQPTLPESLLKNDLKLIPKDQDNFIKNYEQKQRNLELSIIKNNLTQEIQDQLVDLATPDINSLRKKIRNRKLRESLVELRNHQKLSLYERFLKGLQPMIIKVQQEAKKEQAKRERKRMKIEQQKRGIGNAKF